MARVFQFFKYTAIHARNKITVGSQMRYALWMPYLRVEMKPPTLSDMPEVLQRLKNLRKAAITRKYLTLTVKESFQNFLVCFEIYCWFLLGEVIGRGGLPGYTLNIGDAYGTDFPVYSIVYAKKPFNKKKDYSEVDVD